MSFNLLDATKRLITSELTDKASYYLNENENGIERAFSGIIPSLFGAITHRAATNGGATIVSNLANTTYNAGLLNNVNGFFENDNGSNLLNKGAGLLSGLFCEDKINVFSKIISKFSGIKPESAQTLLNMSTPLVLGVLGKHASANNLNAKDLSSLLIDNKKSVINALPGGLNLSRIFHGLESREKESVRTQHAIGIGEKSKNVFKWLMPLSVLALVAFVAWYFIINRNVQTSIMDQIDSLRAASSVSNLRPNKDTTANTAGKLDSITGNFMYNTGKIITIDLPDGAGKIKVGENSTENKLYKFLMDRSGKLNEVKGNWFEFTDVHFKSGGTQFDSASIIQLKNITAITKAFPTAEFKIGGYTDNTGDSAVNVALSQKRADVVLDELKKLGASTSAVTGAKGYGPQWALRDNSTPEGRAINRRVAVNVKAR